MTYKCIECAQHYCESCDGGVDTCNECHQGPFCDDCAIEHTDTHREEGNVAFDEIGETESEFDSRESDFDPNDDYRK